MSSVRGRRITALIAAGVLALAAVGCGDGDEIAPEVPGPPADVALPDATVAPTSDENSDSSGTSDSSSSTDEGTTDEGTTDEGTTDESATPDASGTTPDASGTTPDASGTTPDTGAATPDSSGGTAAPDTSADGPTNDTPPPADSEAQQFEDFCAQNPGAC
jgi:hypothetical protein